MAWNDRFQIGDGERTTDEAAPAVYRSYDEDCGIVMSKAVFDNIAQRFKIYFATTDLKDIVFTPTDILPQTSSDYYFTHLTVKIPYNP